MFRELAHWFLGCWIEHNYGFPLTKKKMFGTKVIESRTYVVCLDCGQEFNYDWERMQVVTKHEREPARVQLGLAGTVRPSSQQLL